jgi:hypothetical protein
MRLAKELREEMRPLIDKSRYRARGNTLFIEVLMKDGSEAVFNLSDNGAKASLNPACPLKDIRFDKSGAQVMWPELRALPYHDRTWNLQLLDLPSSALFAGVVSELPHHYRVSSKRRTIYD